jgi:Flp pilus assembly protein TadD
MLRGTFLSVVILGMVVMPPPSFGQGIGRAGSTAGSTTSIPKGPYLSGHVAFEDGAVPAGRIIIESVCEGRTRQETTTDKRGEFGFTLGQGSGDQTLETANIGNHAGAISAPSVQDCVLQAKLPGYTSDVVYLASLPKNKPDVGTIILHKGAAVARAAGETAVQVPKDARKAFEKGQQAAQEKKWPEAATNFRKAADLDPKYADALLELGKAQLALKQPDDARKSFEAAIKADGNYAQPYLQLLQMENQAQNWKGVTEVAERLLKVSPGLPQVYFMQAAAYYTLRNLEGAENSARQGIKMDTQHQAPRLHEVLGSCLVVRGDFAGAAAELKQYLEVSPLAPDAALVKSQIADLETKAQGKK